MDIQSLLASAKSVQSRLLDSESHATDAAVPAVASDAAAIIGRLVTVIQGITNQEWISDMAKCLGVNAYLCDPQPANTTLESLSDALNETGAFPEDVIVWGPFEQYPAATVFQYMVDLRDSVRYLFQAIEAKALASLSAPEETEDMVWYAVTGRIPGDDEDSSYVLRLPRGSTREDVFKSFEALIYEDETDPEASKDSVFREHGVTVFVNSIVVSDTEIKEA